MQGQRHVARIILVMGVSGSGKSCVGEALARRLGCAFQEGDALHPPENVAKMRSGQPLDDTDRRPWLAAIAAMIDKWRARGESGVVTCSALKRGYRRFLTEGRPEVRLVHLVGSRALIARRLAERRGHFMPPGLLDSQLATLEPPAPEENAITVAIDAAPEVIVDQIVAALPRPGDPLGAACSDTAFNTTAPLQPAL